MPVPSTRRNALVQVKSTMDRLVTDGKLKQVFFGFSKNFQSAPVCPFISIIPGPDTAYRFQSRPGIYATDELSAQLKLRLVVQRDDEAAFLELEDLIANVRIYIRDDIANGLFYALVPPVDIDDILVVDDPDLDPLEGYAMATMLITFGNEDSIT